MLEALVPEPLKDLNGQPTIFTVRRINNAHVVTIPVRAMEKLGWMQGLRLTCTVSGDRLVFQKAKFEDDPSSWEKTARRRNDGNVRVSGTDKPWS
jgi:antitoxin component of MazEF toxin-antitoxin module